MTLPDGRNRRHRPAGTDRRQVGILPAALGAARLAYARNGPGPHGRRGAAQARPKAPLHHRRAGPVRRGTPCGPDGGGRPDMESAEGRRRDRSALRPRPGGAGRTTSNRAGTAARRPARRIRRRGAGVGHPRPHAAGPSQAHREARPRPHLRLALDRPQGAGRADGRLDPEGLPRRHPPYEGFGLAARPRGRGADGWPSPDRGLALLARRDRTSVAVARKRWSVALEDAEGPFEWRNVTGRRGRQLFQEHGAHRRRPRLPGRARRPGPPAGVGGRPARPAQEGVPPLPARRQDARRQPRTPSAYFGRTTRAGPSSWSGNAAPCAPPPCPTGSPPICATSLLTGPPTTTAQGPPSWSSSTTTSPGPTSCAWRGRRCPRIESSTVPLLVSHREAIDALGPMGHAWRTPADRETPQALPPPMNDEGRRPMPKQDTHKQEGPRGRRGRIVVRLDTAAVWKRLASAEPLPELARQGDRGQPRLRVDAGQLGALALRSHPPPDAQGPGSNRVPRPIQIGGER